ncbi:FHA domain-containing protein [Streptomyces indicus]|uniref:FtsK/SpoIIIE family protein n=1 Tax=Streptomyces indicus TaxID=417292 RepID=A0A1G9DZP8_9ACTN|nr:FHA domain-containing protein [Streptomyces indicus]SDK69343.1 FtsK/SpoIIIE family protein [Streptomyces indicus]
MQIRLTVLGPPSGRTQAAHRAVGAVDVLVTAPAGTALAAVASGLAAAAGTEAASAAHVVLYAGPDRLDSRTCVLGEPPLVDGAVLALHSPADPAPTAQGAAARLHVVAGPDAGGVHLLHGGRITIGRSADADVPLDDPDVSRLHCAVTLADDGRVTVTDLGSTNGTGLDGTPVHDRPVRLTPGALLRIGESTLRLSTTADPEPLSTAPDGEGHLRVTTGTAGSGAGSGAGAGVPRAASSVRSGEAVSVRAGETPPVRAGETPPVRAGETPPVRAGETAAVGNGAQARVPAQASPEQSAPPPAPAAGTHHAYGQGDLGAPAAHSSPAGPASPAGPGPSAEHDRAAEHTHAPEPGQGDAEQPGEHGRTGTPTRGTTVPRQLRRRGIGAWARRLAGGRTEQPPEQQEPAVQAPPAERTPAPETWPDPAALLLTALGPGPRLWERAAEHPEALAVRLGTVDRPLADDGALLPAVPVTVGLREAGGLGLAGPRARLSGLARSVLAQLAALHAPTELEIVLLSTDRSRTVDERVAEWSWLGWLPHLRPGRGEDCRLLVAFDREQAAARTDELIRRIDERLDDTDATGRPAGPRTLLVVDGDPGPAALRAATVRLAEEGPQAGIHVLCLAETPAASPSSPVADTYEAACTAVPAFRSCGAVALLSGDVATALRLLRTARGQLAGHGTVASVDAVSLAWAERFARALAPLRTAETGPQAARLSSPLPQAARLLDELGLARATPASLLARWAAAADDHESPGGRAWTVLGAGPRGPVCVDLVAQGPHVMVEGPPGSGRTELLRSLAASLASAERPDRLGLVLVDGAGAERGSAGGGLRPATDLPHVTTHLTANDPVRMREFAQSLTAELKRRSELLGRAGFAEWHTGRAVASRMVAQRSGAGRGEGPGRGESSGLGAARTDRTGRPVTGTEGAAPAESAADLDAPPSATLKLRTGGRSSAGDSDTALTQETALPRLVVVVDDLDALVAPALGAPGRPSAGSVVRALEAVVREGERLGVHLIAASGRPERTADSLPARAAAVRIILAAPSAAPEDPAPGRGRLLLADGQVVPFQAGRVTGRIPRTATLRPTAVVLEWERMGDPPDRRPVRELGNGPTDLALLASALERAARSVAAREVPSLL